MKGAVVVFVKRDWGLRGYITHSVQDIPRIGSCGSKLFGLSSWKITLRNTQALNGFSTSFIDAAYLHNLPAKIKIIF